MNRVFIVNPHAGNRDNEALISDLIARADIDADILLTKGHGHATKLVRDYCATHSFRPICFYACGGDGTINEVVNGAMGIDDVCVYPFPCGSGNDFVKYYGTAEDFMTPEAISDIATLPADLIRVGDRYSINVANFGFDAAVCKIMNSVRHKKLIGGKNSYTTGIVGALLKNMKTSCDVYADGEHINNGSILLCTVANGNYVGGQYKCAPLSDNTDGLLEICLVNPVSRFTFIKLIGDYKKGTHLDPKLSHIVTYRRGRTLRVTAEEEIPYCLDGEIFYAREFEMEAVQSGITLAIPRALAEKKAKSNAK